MAKTKTKKPTKPASKPSAKAKSKPTKPTKVVAKAASKKAKPSKSLAKQKTTKVVTPKIQASSVKTPALAKKTKAPKKEVKKEAEELDIFDDGDVSESEELLEYQAELEISEELEEEVETETDDEDLDTPVVASDSDEDVILTDADGNRYCRAKDCDQTAAVDGYCRFHYLLFWKKIQIRKDILIDGKLEKYVEDLTSRYPDKFLEVLRKDLKTTKDFLAAIAELEIDESAGENEFEEDAQTFIDEVRGISDVAGSSSMDDDEF
jgi:hypothetical protein